MIVLHQMLRLSSLRSFETVSPLMPLLVASITMTLRSRPQLTPSSILAKLLGLDVVPEGVVPVVVVVALVPSFVILRIAGVVLVALALPLPVGAGLSGSIQGIAPSISRLIRLPSVLLLQQGCQQGIISEGVEEPALNNHKG